MVSRVINIVRAKKKKFFKKTSYKVTVINLRNVYEALAKTLQESSRDLLRTRPGGRRASIRVNCRRMPKNLSQYEIIDE